MSIKSYKWAEDIHDTHTHKQLGSILCNKKSTPTRKWSDDEYTFHRGRNHRLINTQRDVFLISDYKNANQDKINYGFLCF